MPGSREQEGRGHSLALGPYDSCPGCLHARNLQILTCRRLHSSFITSFKRYLLNAYYVLGSFLSIWGHSSEQTKIYGLMEISFYRQMLQGLSKEIIMAV